MKRYMIEIQHLIIKSSIFTGQHLFNSSANFVAIMLFSLGKYLRGIICFIFLQLCDDDDAIFDT